MVGLVADRPLPLRTLLREGARNLGALSTLHPDGWGIAAWSEPASPTSQAAEPSVWRIARSVGCAAECPRYRELAGGLSASVVIAHVRKKTVGGTALANTHPFRSGRFVLAHNGTIADVAALAPRTAPEHLAAIEGETDSERLLAFLMTRIDETGDVAGGLAGAAGVLAGLGPTSATTFLLSDGARMFAHRRGRPLFLLARARGGRATSVAIASEPLTDEVWSEVAEGALVVVRAEEQPVVELMTPARAA
jgi:predicted glutamine amidotransferase